MAYGASIKSQTGDLLVDDTYDTYVYLGTYTPTYIAKETNWETSTTNPSFNPHYHNMYVDIPSTTRPIVFFKPPVTLNWSWQNDPYYNVNVIPGMGLVSIMEISPNVWRARFMTTTGGGTSLVKAFAATKTKGPSTVTQGMRVYNSSNQLIFDSGWKMLNPVAAIETFYPLQSTNSNTIGGSVTLVRAYSSIAGAGVTSAGADPDLWISCFTREPNVFIRLGSRPYTATVGFKAFSTVAEYGNTSYSVIDWNACWNSNDLSYSIQAGSINYTNTSYLVLRDTGTYFP